MTPLIYEYTDVVSLRPKKSPLGFCQSKRSVRQSLVSLDVWLVRLFAPANIPWSIIVGVDRHQSTLIPRTSYWVIGDNLDDISLVITTTIKTTNYIIELRLHFCIVWTTSTTQQKTNNGWIKLARLMKSTEDYNLDSGDIRHYLCYRIVHCPTYSKISLVFDLKVWRDESWNFSSTLSRHASWSNHEMWSKGGGIRKASLRLSWWCRCMVQLYPKLEFTFRSLTSWRVQCCHIIAVLCRCLTSVSFCSIVVGGIWPYSKQFPSSPTRFHSLFGYPCCRSAGVEEM